VVGFTLLEDFECPLCEDFGIVEVEVGPPFGLASERREVETEWRVCQCQKGEGRRPQGGSRP
jgi:hypothetical protein